MLAPERRWALHPTSIIKIIIFTRRHDRGTTRRWALGRIAPNLGLQFVKISEQVGLAPQLISNHWRLGSYARDHSHSDAMTLHCFDQRTKVAITREQYHLIYMSGQFHGIDR
jgi:hypothetical protein